MKKFILFLFTLGFLTTADSLLAQGSLVPSGPPAPSMVTLAQIVGPLITTTGTIPSANPWANFSY